MKLWFVAWLWMAVNGFAGVTSVTAGSCSGVWITCVKRWKHNSEAIKGVQAGAEERISALPQVLVKTLWYNSNIPVCEWRRQGTHTERKQRKNNLNNSKCASTAHCSTHSSTALSDSSLLRAIPVNLGRRECCPSVLLNRSSSYPLNQKTSNAPLRDKSCKISDFSKI